MSEPAAYGALDHLGYLSEPYEGPRLRIAMVGLRGVPATYGGIERHVEELGARLVARGHEVTVYCRPGYAGDRRATYRDIRLEYRRTLNTKYLDNLIHTAISAASAVRSGVDIVHFHAMGPSLLTPFVRIARHPGVVVTVHGLDGDRAKWGRVGRTILGAGEWMSANVPHETVVVSEDLARHFRDEHDRRTTYIPNGVSVPGPMGCEVLDLLGLEKDRYVLFVGRLVPEKAPEALIRAFRAIDADVKLVIVGGSSHTKEYVRRLHKLQADDPRVVMPGYVFGDHLHQLYAHAAVFVLPSLLEGLPLTLLEAVAHGTPVVASDIAPHREVLSGSTRPGAQLVPTGDDDALTKAMMTVLADTCGSRRAAAASAGRVLARYNWDVAAGALEEVYCRVIQNHPRLPRR